MSHPSTSPPARSDLTSASWWFRSKDGRLVLWQPPNPALLVWFTALIVGRFSMTPEHDRTVAGIQHGALLVWALDELLRGSSPFRRVLGAMVLIGQLALLTRDW